MIESPKTLEQAIENGLSQCIGTDESNTEVKTLVASEIVAIHVREFLAKIVDTAKQNREDYAPLGC